MSRLPFLAVAFCSVWILLVGPACLAQTPIVRIAAGSSGSGSWLSDRSFSGGTALGPVAATVGSAEIVNAAPQTVYQSARNGTFSYTITGLSPNTNYIIRLHFCENWATAVGQRQFNVTIGTTQVLTNFDVYAVSGGKNIAIAENFPTQASSSGAITISFANNAIVSGIEADSNDGFLVSTPTSLNLQGSSFRPNGVNLGNWMEQEAYMMGTSNNLFLQVNSGGAASGSWLADSLFSSGTVLGPISNSINISGVTSPAPMSVYQSARSGTFSYAISGLTPNASYVVRLHFAENWKTAAGQRLFNVAVNGTTVLSNFDVFAAAGGEYIGIVRQYYTAADTSGNIAIAFSNNAIVNGIELESDQGDSMQAYFDKAAGSAANYNTWYTSWLNNYITQADIQTIKSEGFNALRVPLNYADFLDSNGDFVDEGAYPSTLPAGAPRGLTYMDDLVSWCSAAGIVMMPDMHIYPSNCWVSNYSTDNANLDTIKAAWQTVAARYSGQTCILGYDLLNEPPGYLNSSYRPTYQQIRDAIRTYDTNHVIVTESNVYSDLGSPGNWYLASPIDSNQEISAHFYQTQPQGYTIAADAPGGSIYRAWQYCTTYDMPFIMGEYGENDNTDDNTIMEVWKQGYAGFTGGTIFWTYKKPGAVRCIAKASSDPNWGTVATYVSNGAYGTPPANAFTIMMNEASDMSASNVVVQKDVLDSLTRDNYQTNLPYISGATVPGHIDCVNYDLGAQGYAFKTSYGYTPFWTFRNDDVGTTYSGDSIGTGYMIGDINVGDFERYTVKVIPGTYKLNIRYAGYGGMMRVLVGGVSIAGEINLPSTNGWYSWTTLTLNNIPVTASGQTTLEIDCDASGYNIDYVELLDTPPTIAAPAAASPATVVAKSTTLTVLGAYVQGESNLTYTWSVTGPAAVSFSSNGTNAAKSSVATFSAPGSYVFTVTVSNPSGQTVTSSVAVTVAATPSKAYIAPSPGSVVAAHLLQMTSAAKDQFGVLISPAPTTTWSVTSGGGMINSSGIYTAPIAAGSATVTASIGSVSASSVITINPASGGSGGLLSGIVATPGPLSVNLTNEGTVDWIHWGSGLPGVNRKASGGSMISSYTSVGTGKPTVLISDPRSMAWSDGTPTASASANKGGVDVAGTGSGFSFTVPASSTQRTLTIYVGGGNAGGQLSALLSDGSAPSYSITIPTTTGYWDAQYTLTYSAASSGQTLTILWTNNSGTGEVSLSAADLH